MPKLLTIMGFMTLLVLTPLLNLEAARSGRRSERENVDHTRQGGSERSGPPIYERGAVNPRQIQRTPSMSRAVNPQPVGVNPQPAAASSRNPR